MGLALGTLLGSNPMEQEAKSYAASDSPAHKVARQAGKHWQTKALWAHAEESSSGLLDSDQDLLPDEAEWVLLSNPKRADTDNDGDDDFIEAIEHSSPISGPSSKLSPRDGFRILINTTSAPAPIGRYFWIHLLFRLPSGKEQDIRGTALLFGNRHQQQLDLSPLLASPLVREVKTRRSSKHGLLKRISIRLPEPIGFSTLAPSSFRSYTLIKNKIHASGGPILFLNGAYHVLTHLSKRKIVLQSSGQTELSNPFWSAQKACVLKVETHAYSKLGILCEIVKADCVTAQVPSCTSACKGSVGLLFTFPDALSLILGG